MRSGGGGITKGDGGGEKKFVIFHFSTGRAHLPGSPFFASEMSSVVVAVLVVISGGTRAGFSNQ